MLISCQLTVALGRLLFGGATLSSSRELGSGRFLPVLPVTVVIVTAVSKGKATNARAW